MISRLSFLDQPPKFGAKTPIRNSANIEMNVMLEDEEVLY